MSDERKRLRRRVLMSAYFFVALGLCSFVRALAADEPAVAAVEYAAPRRLGTVSDPQIREASGIAASRQNDGCFWLHNDSGDGPRLFLVDREGATRGVFQLDGAIAIDWEDICSFELGERRYLLVGDVGDNLRLRPWVTLYLLEEPAAKPANDCDESALPAEALDRPENLSADVEHVSLVAAIPVVYEDGPQNCESVAVDPSTKTVYLISKTFEDTCIVYELPLVEQQPDKQVTAKAVATLTIPTTLACDMSHDARRAIVLTKNTAFEYARGDDQPWAEAFAQAPRALPMPKRRAGEAVCYGVDGRTLYLASEGERQPLWEVRAAK